ncbi:uncharacterized protein Z520_01288 [Fonsecaea multimorphosa CBS 102226]|uniref:RBR-type E3 ubiquitin transferase n=1 Tax=Fonsecaea multimorphosa CBS 102226 TaxID=1442371 RepID=A0A0D2K9U9_9EURO|nr:uncharacterized protein Z520_01288 [Fonsecaea multimorphosa CBS 102226]KIY02823.1 hypothetical protein Z520_01288 [Fonsecaea multimorphosa CBS 102226]OAL30988.1 hypothetical protein AYO22_01283 [Fonsecaea multimorphosa]
MAVDEVKRRKTHRHKHGDTEMPTSRKRPQDDSATSKPPATATSHPDIDAVRKARLAFLAKPPEEGRKVMKYEYVKRTKASQGDEEKEKRHTATRVPLPSREVRKPERRSTARTDNNRRRPAQDDSEDEYVYARTERASGAGTSATQPEKPPAQRTKSQIQTPKKTEVPRKPLERRYTEPARRKEVYVFEEAPCAGDESLPLPRRMSGLVEKSQKSESKRSTTTAKPKADVGVAKSSEPAGTPKKGPVLLSGLLPPKPAQQRKVSCLTCGDDEIPIAQSALLPCKHRMCNTCLKRIFKMSVTDPAHMPPRCCTDQHIALKHVEKLFDNEWKENWNRKYQEYQTKNRVYCPSRKCGAWIKPKYITIENGRKVGRCKQCKTKVCPMCSRKMHTTRECPKDPETKAFIEAAKEKGWQRCYSCHAMVELKEGCNHMTCRCTAEFCMVCGLKWKSCDCPWFNYEAVDGHLGDPVRYQQEMDRRRDQVNRDEALARRMQQMGLGDDADGQAARMFGLGNGANHHMNQNFIQQAREALTANYAQAGQAAMGLLNGFVRGRENPLPGMPMEMEQMLEMLGQGGNMRDPAEGGNPARRAGRRGTNRRRQARPDEAGELPGPMARGEERRIQDWANDGA